MENEVKLKTDQTMMQKAAEKLHIGKEDRKRILHEP